MALAAVTNVLTDLKNKAQGAFQEAQGWRIKDHCERNKMAESAAADHRGRAEQLVERYSRSGDVRDIMAELRACRDHAAHWHRQFANWSRTDNAHLNGYAEHVHREAEGWYQAALDTLERMKPTVSKKPVKAKLVPVKSFAGKASGTYKEEVTIQEGFYSSTKLSEEIAAKVCAKAEASGVVGPALVSGSVSADVATQLASVSAVQTSRATTRKVTITIHMNKPCYIYQVVTTVPMDFASDVQLFGPIIQSDVPLKTN